MFKYHKRTRQLTSSNQPIVCISDQQAGHVTHRTTSASKYSSQGLSQQLSNIQLRRAIKGNTLINGGNIQQAEFNTKDSYIPRRKSGIYWIQIRRAAAVEIFLWTR